MEIAVRPILNAMKVADTWQVNHHLIPDWLQQRTLNYSMHPRKQFTMFLNRESNFVFIIRQTNPTTFH